MDLEDNDGNVIGQIVPWDDPAGTELLRELNKRSKSGAKPGVMTNEEATAELLRPGGRRIAFIETRFLGMVPGGTMRLFVNDDIDADGNHWCEIHHPSLAAILPGLAIPVVNERLQPIQCRPTWPTRKAT